MRPIIMGPQSVEIVKCRTKGVTGYANVGRGSRLGNPYVYPMDTSRAVYEFSREVMSWGDDASDLLSRDWPDGIVKIACPCNGVFKGQPCHATVIKEYLEAEIERRKNDGAP